MAGVTGLEPAASGVTGQRSNQLSYTPVEPDRLRDGLRPVKKTAVSQGFDAEKYGIHW